MFNNEHLPALIKLKLKCRFYYAVVFLLVVTQACEGNRQRISQASPWHRGDDSPGAIFKEFVDKLSKFCACELGRDTVTAFTILDRQDRYQYRFACNLMKRPQLVRTGQFVTDLLRTLRHVRRDDAFILVLLEKVLCFSRTRVCKYLHYFQRFCHDCIATRPTDTRLLDQLDRCMTAVSEASPGDLSDVEWTQRCKQLMVTIDMIRRDARVNIFTDRQAQSSMNRSANCWYELRHYAGRLWSYHQGVEALVAAAGTFPELFENFEVHPVPSSTPDFENPIQKDISTEKIVRTMVPTAELPYYMGLVKNTRPLDINEAIQKEIKSESFRPIVHAELLVLQSLEREGLTHPSDFFNNWKYIGSSKSTCRLCHEYFEAHSKGFQVRPTHGNLYINWKPPDVFQREGEAAIKKREEMLNAMVGPIRKEALRTLRERIPRGRKHDSSTNMTVPLVTVGGLPMVGGGGGGGGGFLPAGSSHSARGDLETTFEEQEEDLETTFEEQEEDLETTFEEQEEDLETTFEEQEEDDDDGGGVSLT